MKKKLFSLFSLDNLSIKFKYDVFFNVISLSFLGISGILLNFLIIRYYDMATLGFFNQSYAIYMISSQFAVGSVHLSVQKHIPQFLKKKNQLKQIITIGLILTLFYALLTTVFLIFTRVIWANLLHNQNLVFAILIMSPGLVFFALNKTFLAVLNGFRRMKLFALFQSLRYAIMIILLLLAVFLRLKSLLLPAIFSITEFLVLAGLIITNYKNISFKFKINNPWFEKHFKFSYKSFLGNLFTDLNVRVNVLILSFFLSIEAIGIYSFAATIIEGFFQLFVLLKANVNPILAKLATKKNYFKLHQVINQGIKITYIFSFAVGIISIILYPLMIKLLKLDTNLFESYPVFLILMTGLVVTSGYQPFQQLLIQINQPSSYTKLMAITVIANFGLNILLVPILGINGSALGTAISYLISVLGLKILTKQAINLRI